MPFREAFTYERLFLELMIIKNFTNVDGSTPMYVVKENLVPGYSAWLLYRDMPFKRNLDKCILAFHEVSKGAEGRDEEGAKSKANRVWFQSLTKRQGAISRSDLIC